MSSFAKLHGRRVTGELTMFDRMIFKGHLSQLYHPGGIRVLLWKQGVPLTGFGTWAKSATEALCLHAQRMAEEAGRPYVYLDKTTTRHSGQTKEDLARKIAKRDGVTEGLVCILRIIEPCSSFDLRRNHATHQLEVVPRQRKCIHHYFYFLDPEFGFIHLRLQTWLPFQIQIYVNGREWLARQLDAARVGSSARTTRSCVSMTSKPPPTCVNASPTEPGPASSTPSPAGSTPTCRRSRRPASGGTTGSSTKPRWPPT